MFNKTLNNCEDTRNRDAMDRPDTLHPSSSWRARKYRRFDLALPVLMTLQSGSTTLEIEGISKNISIGGLLVTSARFISRYTPVTLTVKAYGEKAVRPIHLVGEGEVVRVEKAESEATFVIAVKCKAPVVEREEP